MGNLFQELKRRKVFRVAVAYAVVAWVLIQISGEVLPALQMPEWTVSFVTVLLLLGFPLALLLGWAYEITPQGVRADSAPPSQSATTTPSDRKLIYATFGLVLLVAGFQISDRFLTGEPTSLSPVDGEPTLSTVEVTRTNLNMGLSSSEFYSSLNTGIDITPDGRAVIVSS
ncbi:MAG: hypothetical protein QGG67_05070 [Gammaproteobacteria bacterium]|jgi:hypothetical protein|nr:hypothetical protein [Gammaproteobacteria bacterium]MDP6095350.1 hypothetical protein [Gammaproteobacteria bacterium]MDP7455342.1 hypothetical protein [Gammaproteobacteria bacterium]HJO10605.1 hypothetical protein [Gammaproteobacteria bacterium]|tara:strand:+ start:475 stop:987 length:513 start_codon:yes stop_codon:yes gene_type:complete